LFSRGAGYRDQQTTNESRRPAVGAGAGCRSKRRIGMELLVIGLLLFGVVFLAYAAVAPGAHVRRLETPDQRNAPMIVRRGSGASRAATDPSRSSRTA